MKRGSEGVAECWQDSINRITPVRQHSNSQGTVDDSLRVLQVVRQAFTIEDDNEVVQYISAQENIGAVSRDAAHCGKVKAFQREPDIIDWPLRVSPVVSAGPNAALRTDSELSNKPLRNNGDIGARI